MLNNKAVISVELIIAALIVILTVCQPTIMLILLGTVSLYYRKKRWKDVGLSIPKDWPKTILTGTILGIVIAVFGFFIMSPIIQFLTGSAGDYSLFKNVQGDIFILIAWMAVNWTLGAIGEELAYRGYFLNRAMDLFGKNTTGIALSILLVSACFGFAHLYQGLPGVLDKFVFAAMLSIIYFAGRKNLLLPIVTHGVANTVAFLAIYFGLLAI